MRKFFSFRPSASSEKDNPKTLVSNDENFFWDVNGADLQRNSTTSKVLDSSRLRRSLSFSSSTPFSREIEGRCNSSRDLSGSLSDHTNMPHQSFESSIRSRSCKSQHDSPRNSHLSSPPPVRCKSFEVTQRLNKEDEEKVFTFREGQLSPFIGHYNSVAEKKIHPSSRRPPKSNDFGYVSPNKPPRKYNERDKVNLQDNLSQAATSIEDTDVDSSKSLIQKHASTDHISLDKILDRYFTGEQGESSWNDYVASRNDHLVFPEKHDLYFDEELHMKLHEVEETLKSMSEASDDSGDILSERCSEERKKLASELSRQLHSRISERSASREALKQARRDLDTRTRRLEKEKDELQSTLEKELDRRSTNWSIMLEKFQVEEQRLRERVRELAEQNVSVQREISFLSGKKQEAQDNLTELESKLIGVTVQLKETGNENATLKETLSDLQEKFNAAGAIRESMERRYKEAEVEAIESKKAIAKLHLIRVDQEKTIAGLRQGIVKQADQQSEDLVRRLKAETVRAAGIEQLLRKEIESLASEVESLKNEKSFIFTRVRSCGSSRSFLAIDQELHSQMECLKKESFSLLDEGISLCDESFKRFDGYLATEHNVKLQGLRRAVKLFKGRVKSLSGTLDQRSKLDDLENQLKNAEHDAAQEESIELNLRAETLMTSALREKLLHKELELERVRAELGSVVREREGLQTEIIRLRDDDCSLRHKMKDMEHQIMNKEESIKMLQQDLQEGRNELIVMREMMPRISGERDCLWEELTKSRETNMLLGYEVNTLKKKIDALDEEILLKEGQISILKDNLE